VVTGALEAVRNINTVEAANGAGEALRGLFWFVLV
jgi:hypothetical protein